MDEDEDASALHKKKKRWYFLQHGISFLLITEKLLFWIFWRWKIWYFWAKKLILMEIWYLLVTEKFLFWTIREWEIRSFLSQEVDGKMIFRGYWEVVVFNFSLMENTVFFLPNSWSKDDIYLVFLSFSWYSNLSKDLSLLECFSTSVGINVTDKSLRTILLIQNNFIVPSLCTLSISSRIISYCVKIRSDNKQLSPCCSKYLNRIPTSHTKLSFDFGGLKLNMTVTYLFINGFS